MDGDSVYLNQTENVGVNNDMPLSYLWQPSHGLIVDTLPTNIWAKPTQDISYYVTVEDSLGCVTTGAPMYHINVHHVGLTANKLKDNFRIYPNPALNQIHFINGNMDKIKRIVIFNTFGEIVKNVKPSKTISITDLSSGTYHIELRFNNGESLIREVIIK